MLHHELNQQIDDWTKHAIIDISISIKEFEGEEELTRDNITQQHVNRAEGFDWRVELLLLTLNDGDDWMRRANGLIQILDRVRRGSCCNSFAEFVRK